VYVVAAGLFNDAPEESYISEIAFFLIDICKYVETALPFVSVKAGLHCGSVMSGVICNKMRT
jgi:hypothetical protein